MDNKLTRYVLKNSKKRNSNLKYDFLPSLLEIIERPSHIAGTVITISITLLLVCAVIWANFSKIDVVVNGMGNIMPEGKVIDIQSATSGKVNTIHVKAGDYVRAGDILISLDNESTNIDLKQLEYNIEWCGVRKEISQKRLENDEYDIQIGDYDSKFANGINQLILEIELYKNQKTERQKNLEEAKRDLEEAEENNNEYTIPSMRSRVEQLEESIKSNAISQKSQMYSQLFSLDREMEGYNIQVEKIKLDLESLIIKSPVNGYVNMISIVSTGQVISAGNVVASIVPGDPEFQFECYIQDKDRSEIEVGKEVIIKLSAFPFSDYGSVTGKVSYISSSTFTNEKYGNFYVVNIEIDYEKLNPNIKLTSGLSGSVEIIVGHRTVLQYFLEPITKGLSDSLKEN